MAHSILPEALTRAADAVFEAAGVRHVAHGVGESVRAAGEAAAGQRALVVAGEHDYGRQLDGQLRLAGLPCAERADEADLVILAGLAGEPEIARAAASAPLPIVAFDGAQGAPLDGVPTKALLGGVERAQRAAELVVRAVAEGAADRRSMLTALPRLGGFDPHGDPPNPRSGYGARTPPGSCCPTARLI